jgi:hypothetical protein
MSCAWHIGDGIAAHSANLWVQKAERKLARPVLRLCSKSAALPTNTHSGWILPPPISPEGGTQACGAACRQMVNIPNRPATQFSQFSRVCLTSFAPRGSLGPANVAGTLSYEVSEGF